uniref:SWIM-type domain-containing protein n=1 Tax=Lactuca sativa TaxID=4236 RepID=A0A9R1VBH5_LACSA|nr:hypothetical protein LSAT_V11C600324940 [Lactuca sativa]
MDKSRRKESFNRLSVYLYNVHAFICCFLHVIFIYSVHLRGDHLKTMFIAVVINENNQTIHIAFALAMENKSLLLYMVPYEGREVSFITNIDDVVSSYIEHVFSDSYHGYTSKSVFKYMRTRGVSGRTLQPLFWMTSGSYTMSDFEENFRRLTPDAHETLANIGHAKWARLITLTSVGILTIILTSYVEMVLHKRMQKSVRWQATKIPPEIPSLLPSDIYLVFYLKKTCVVHLNRHTCSCGKWRNLGIACDHAIVVSRHSNIHELPNMVQIYYRVDMFQTAYQTQTMHPFPIPSE